MKAFVINLIIILSTFSCFSEDGDYKKWIQKKYPIETHYNEHKALLQIANYYLYVLDIDLDSESALSDINRSWSMLGKAVDCEFYVFAYQKKDHLYAIHSKKRREKLEKIILNSFSKRLKYKKVDSEYKGYSRKSPKIHERKKNCNFKLK
tara:strand:- start:9197 stop:9646 length:450 start_codon:yes stop_codon:yes gene_type:complete